MKLLLWTPLLAILARGLQADSRMGDLAAAIAAMGAAQDCDVQVCNPDPRVEHIQGDTSRCSVGSVHMKTRVAF